MRRVTASLLAAFFSLTLISPALFAADPDSNLPACCRRSGHHHCTNTNQDSSAVPALQQARCSVYPSAPSVPAIRASGLTKDSQTVFATLISHPSSRPQTEALCRISLGRAGLKRGPPAV
jgi:hypothetical protein